MNPQNFVKNRLEVERSGGNGHYQLTDESVSPTVLLESDENGVPREMTIPAAGKYAKFVDGSGNICDVPLRTGRVFSDEPEAKRYEDTVVFDLIRGGQLPLSFCPYTLMFSYIKPGPLVKPPKDFVLESCKGAIDGCAHMKAIIEKRVAANIERTAKQEADLGKKTVTEEQAKSLFATMTEGLGQIVGEAIRDGISDGRKHLKGAGEKDASK